MYGASYSIVLRDLTDTGYVYRNFPFTNYSFYDN